METPLPETAVLVAVEHAVGVAVGAFDAVGVGVGGGGPGQMFIAARANPGEGLAVGQSPAINCPLLLKDPKHVLPPPQLAIETPRTNNATGATTNHSVQRNMNTEL
jgi:hypothetical protein